MLERESPEKAQKKPGDSPRENLEKMPFLLVPVQQPQATVLSDRIVHSLG